MLLVLPAWLAFDSEPRQPAASIRWTWSWPWTAVGVAVTAVTAPVFSVPGGVLAGLGIAVASGFRAGPADPAPESGPRSLWARDRRIFWLLTLAVGGPLGLGWGMLIALAGQPVTGLGVGLGLGLWIGLTVAFTSTVWGAFAVVRYYLVTRRRLPRDLMAFLADAHERRGVLRRVGAVYQFRHIELQRHLAG